MIAGSLAFPFPFQRGGPAQGYEGRVRPRVSYARLVGILSFKKPHLRQWLCKKAEIPASPCVFPKPQKAPRACLASQHPEALDHTCQLQGYHTVVWERARGMTVPGTILSGTETRREEIRIAPVEF